MTEIVINDYTKVEDNKYLFTDVAGKVIQGNIKDFTDFDTDLGDSVNIQDGLNSNFKGFEPRIVDSENNELTISDSEIVNDIKKGDIVALEVSIEATHSGDNLNSAMYTSKSMQNDSFTFLSPYKKPLIKNHDITSEPIGRIIGSTFCQSEIEPSRDCIEITSRVTDMDSMIKFADKRYSTVSIGGSPKTIECNICGKHILKDGVIKFCGHWKGNTYRGQKSIWITTDIDYKECSIVNNPADVFAQVKEIKVIRGEKENNMSKPKNNNDSNLDNIDNLLGNGTNVNSNGEGAASTEDNTNTNPSNANPPVEDSQAEITNLKEQVKTLTDEKTASENKVKELEDSVEDLKDEVEELKGIRDANLETAKKMARMNKDLLIKVVKLSGYKDSEDLESKTAKELGAILDSLETAKTEPRKQVKVKNEGLAIGDNHTVKDDENDNEGQGEEGNKEPKRRVRLNDRVNEIAELFCK